MITSTGNAQIKETSALVKKAKERRERGLFIVEGARMFSEAPKDRLEKIFASDSFLKQLIKQERDGDAFFGGRPVEIVSDGVMKYLSDTQTPQGIMAVMRQFSYSLEELLKGPGTAAKRQSAHLVLLETLQDPGNLGTILRAGEGAGVTGVIMSPDTADIYNPKVIRSTMGSIYRVPFVYVKDLKSAVSRVKESGVSLFAAHLKGKISYEEADYSGNIGFLIGNEANGLSIPIADMADSYVRIPMAGQVESLNAAVAASVLMFETARQRRALNL